VPPARSNGGMLHIERLRSSCLRDAHTLTTALTMTLLVTLATDASAARRVWTGKGRDANRTTAQRVRAELSAPAFSL
jgi:hypothetical protein